ncbi:hypothetical protein [Pedobacter xixiisoli]|uniref:Polysaccharide lyase n=1 Tax=Pedobacter xixiisoli TaxID=1476464 RepID=A0A285ZUJ8_9SPHI|nr:hypothetical protein [Pedobacter xixiisoli]SOD13306.1 hypothetical protein SAMN06297358_1133 [Pedobacter xixiisoli]
MKKRLHITAALTMLFGIAQAQNKAWSEAGTFDSKGAVWNYNLGKGTGNAGDKFSSGEAIKTSVSSTATPGFLAYPSSGFAAVTTGANAGGAIKVEGKDAAAKLVLEASSNASANKFAVYDISKASAVSSLLFNVSFKSENDPTNGAVVFGIGNARGNNIFKNTAALTGADAVGLFAGLRWEFSTNKAVFFSYRKLNNGSYGYKLINANSFTKTGEHQVELYINNAATEQKYTKLGTAYTLAPATFNIWVDGKLIAAESGSAFPASGELAPEAPLNSFLFQGYHSKGAIPNTLTLSLSNIQLNSTK